MPKFKKGQSLRYRVRCNDPGCGKVAHVSADDNPQLQAGGYVPCCFKFMILQCPGRMRKMAGTQAVKLGSGTLREVPNYDQSLAITLRGSRRASLKLGAPIVFTDPVLDPEDELEVIALEQKEDLVDPGFEPPVQFHPEMRYTHGDMAQRKLFALPAVSKTTDVVPVGGMNIAERQIATKSKMGGKPAWSFARDAGAPNAKKWKEGSRGHYEYCHLQGCALGGRTKGKNLVAGHFALNTYMMVIEGVLQAKTNYLIKVDAYCVIADVADIVRYSVYRQAIGNPKFAWSVYIDGQITEFSANDAAEVRASMKAAGIK